MAHLRSGSLHCLIYLTSSLSSLLRCAVGTLCISVCAVLQSCGVQRAALRLMFPNRSSVPVDVEGMLYLNFMMDFDVDEALFNLAGMVD